MKKNILEQKIVNDLTITKRGLMYQYIVDRVDRELITAALRTAAGNKVFAAKILGINRNTIHAKIKKLKIQANKYKI